MFRQVYRARDHKRSVKVNAALHYDKFTVNRRHKKHCGKCGEKRKGVKM